MGNTTLVQPDRISEQLLRKTGRWHIPTLVLALQLLILPGVAVWAVLLKINAELTYPELGTVIPVMLGLAILGSLLLAMTIHLRTFTASQRLGRWAANETLTSGSPEEAAAWKQISEAPWMLGYLSLVIYAATLLLPFLAYLRISLHATNDQIAYALMGGAVAILGTDLLSGLLLERALVPARGMLLPRTFEAQLAGAAGFRLRGRLVSTVVILLAISVLLLAPVGYHMSYIILYEPLGSEQVFKQLQAQSIAASALVIALGLISAFLLSGSISSPVGNLIKVFSGVEEGDLRRRAPVLASDEVGELAVYFNRMLSRLEALQSGLENQVTARTAQLEATVEVGRVASSILDPDELIERVANLITDRFGHYYAAIFLIDESGAWAELKQATGEAGKILMERRHRLPIGGKSMVSTAIQTRRARIALDVGQEATRFDNPLLPLTRSEIALPLISGDRVLGALDVQSLQGAAFGASDISTLQNMASQVAISIENAHLFRETEEALHALRMANAEALSRAWTDLARGGSTLTYEASAGEPGNGNVSTMEVPLILRDQKVGSIAIQGTAEWTTEERDLVEAVAAQTALAIENARLVNESQQAAVRERLASAITERVWSSSTVEAILQTAVRELGRALEASEATIELKLEGENE